MNPRLEKTYDPKGAEEKWYAYWEDKGYFHADPNPDKTPYCITIPPPNVTGELHMGHAIQHAIHDLVIRWKRMQEVRNALSAGDGSRRNCNADEGGAAAGSRRRVESLRCR